MKRHDGIEQGKALLSVEQQVAHLKSKGVTFELCSEEEAIEYLSEHTYYFKLAAFRTLFQKRVGGNSDGLYASLDFGHLKSLASLDRDLRYALLPMTLDVEHAAHTKLVSAVTKRRDEDGYSIIADYMDGLNHNERRRRESEVGMLRQDVFSGPLVEKYKQLDGTPVWVAMELFSFGSFISFYLFCANRWDDCRMRHEHYMLRQVKSVRNACAHSSVILNGFATTDNVVKADYAVMAALAETGLSHRVRTARMRNPRMRQIATLLYLHRQLVPIGSGRERTCSDLAMLKIRMASMIGLVPHNDLIRSSLAFLIRLIDSWFQ